MAVRRYRIAWLPLREAASFIALHHRHHKPSQGGIVALGMWEGDRLIGVGVIGRPVSKELQSKGHCEIVRSCIRDGVAGTGDHANCAASALLGRLRRAAAALGFTTMVTYTLPEESGSSLAGAGWKQDDMLARGGDWSVPSRPRDTARHPTGKKRRWWRETGAQPEIDLHG